MKSVAVIQFPRGRKAKKIGKALLKNQRMLSEVKAALAEAQKQQRANTQELKSRLEDQRFRVTTLRLQLKDAKTAGWHKETIKLSKEICRERIDRNLTEREILLNEISLTDHDPKRVTSFRNRLKELQDDSRQAKHELSFLISATKRRR